MQLFSKVRITQFSTIVLFTALLGACNQSHKELDSGEAELAKVTKGLVIRGGTCSRAAFIAGAEYSSPNGDYIENLSMNCTTATNNKKDYKNYTNGINGSKFCVAQWPSLDIANVKVVRDPIPNNALHCLISGKTDNIVKKLTYYK